MEYVLLFFMLGLLISVKVLPLKLKNKNLVKKLSILAGIALLVFVWASTKGITPIKIIISVVVASYQLTIWKPNILDLFRKTFKAKIFNES